VVPGRVEVKARDRSHDVDADGFNSDLKEDLGLGEIAWTNVFDGDAELNEGG
jgi:hypothetical protein